LKEKFSKRIHELDEFFQVKQFDFKKVKGKKVEDAMQYAVFCHDLDGLIEHVKLKRQVSEVHLKFGIDGGGGFLKVCLSIQTINDDDDDIDCVRHSYKYGPVPKKFKDSGVKKLFIVGLAESVQENYENVYLLWSTININNFYCS